MSDYGYDETLNAFEKATRKLGFDELDLLILHQPATHRFERTLAAYRHPGLRFIAAEEVPVEVARGHASSAPSDRPRHLHIEALRDYSH